MCIRDRYNTDTLIFAKPLELEYFEFLGKRFVYDVVVGKDFAGKYLIGTYLEVIVDGKCKLYRKYDKKLVAFTQGYKYAAAETAAETYQLQTSLYVKFNENEAPFFLPKKRKILLKLFADQKYELKKFIKQHRLKFTSDDDFIALVNKYNSLI